MQSAPMFTPASVPALGVASAPVLSQVEQPGRRYNLTPLATAVTVLLGLHAVLLALSLLGSALASGIEPLLLLATAVAVVTWLYQARSNANGIGYPHQFPRFVAIAGWFVPFALLYLPVRVVLDVWWARLPPGQRGKATARVLVWWACWCLAWFTSFETILPVTRAANGTTSYGINFAPHLGGTVPSAIFLLLAAVALAVVVRGISAADPNRR